MSDTLRLTIRRLGRDGDGLARRAGLVWSVPGTVPGDVVEALPAGRDPGQAESGTARARLLRVLRPSADRIAPACPAADECGGCDWLHVAPAVRLRAKAASVREALGWSEDAPLEVFASPTERFRRVARLAVGRDRAGPVLGYRHARAHRIARLHGCPALEPEPDAALAALAAAPRALGVWLAARAGELWLLSDEARGVHLAPASGGAGRAARGDRAVAAALESLRAALPRGLDPGPRGPSIEAADGGPALRVPAGGFVQANRALAPELARLACAWSGGSPARVLELYAGSGHLTVALARVAAAVVAVESDAAAAAALAENLDRRGARHVRVVCGDAARAAAEAEAGGVVVADPPRAGLGRAAATLAARRPARIVLVSCDLRALARDARALRDGGYVARRAALLDFFPATHHVEAVTLFEPA